MAMTPLSASPSRADPANFASRSDTLLGALPTFVTEANALQADVNAKQLLTATASSLATNAAATAAAAVNAVAWVSGTTYAIGDARYSPISFQTYRRRTAGAGTTDPSADATNWKLVVQVGEAFATVISTAVSATLAATDLGSLVKVTATGATITLVPVASAPAGSIITAMTAFATGSTIVKGSGAELISNTFGVTANTFALNAGESIQLVSNGTSWDPVGYEATVGGGYRNRIINGDMRIDQRNNGAAVTPSGIGANYTVDRFYLFASQVSKLTVQQAVAPAGFIGFPTCAKITTAVAYTPAANEIFVFNQAIEGFNSSDFGWGTSNAKSVTISFWVQSSIGGMYSTTLISPSGNYAYQATYTLVANAPTFVSVVIPPPPVGSTWGTGNTIGFYFVNSMGCGSSSSSASNAWVAGNYSGVTGGVQLVATLGATFYITGVQLEAGSVATPFERRPYGLELALCQRYYEIGGFFHVASNVLAGNNIGSTIKYAVRKRAGATVVQTNTSAITVSATPQTSSTGDAADSALSYRLVTGSGGGQYSETWTASAEL